MGGRDWFRGAKWGIVLLMKIATLTFSEHALRRMFERSIGREDVRHVIERGEVIATYAEDRPFPTCLLVGFSNGRPLHVVLAVEKEHEHGIVVTVYEPDPLLWENDFRKRRIR